MKAFLMWFIVLFSIGVIAQKQFSPRPKVRACFSTVSLPQLEPSSAFSEAAYRAPTANLREPALGELSWLEGEAAAILEAAAKEGSSFDSVALSYRLTNAARRQLVREAASSKVALSTAARSGWIKSFGCPLDQWAAKWALLQETETLGESSLEGQDGWWQRKAVANRIVQTKYAHEPFQAIDWACRSTARTVRVQLVNAWLKSLCNRSPVIGAESLIHFGQQLPSGAIEYASLLGILSDDNPEAALETLEALDGKVAADQFACAAAIGVRWCERFGCLSAREFSQQIASFERRVGFLAGIGEYYGNLDISEGYSWLATMDDVHERRHAMVGMVRGLVRSDPSEAVKFIDESTDGLERTEVGKNMATGWARFDIDSADRWAVTLEDSGLQESVNNIVMTQVAYISSKDASEWQKTRTEAPYLLPDESDLLAETDQIVTGARRIIRDGMLMQGVPIADVQIFMRMMPYIIE